MCCARTIVVPILKASLTLETASILVLCRSLAIAAVPMEGGSETGLLHSLNAVVTFLHSEGFYAAGVPGPVRCAAAPLAGDGSARKCGAALPSVSHAKSVPRLTGALAAVEVSQIPPLD